MKSGFFAVLPLLAVFAPAVADTVYRCEKNGHVEFSDRMTDPSCQPQEVRVLPPDPLEIERLAKEREMEEARERAEAEEAERLRLIRAQEAAALASKRLSDTRRNLAEQEAVRQQARENATNRDWWGDGPLIIQPLPGAGVPAYPYLPPAPARSPQSPAGGSGHGRPSQIGPKGYPGGR